MSPSLVGLNGKPVGPSIRGPTGRFWPGNRGSGWVDFFSSRSSCLWKWFGVRLSVLLLPCLIFVPHRVGWMPSAHQETCPYRPSKLQFSLIESRWTCWIFPQFQRFWATTSCRKATRFQELAHRSGAPRSAGPIPECGEWLSRQFGMIHV